ncbi:MAG TPA: adenylate/guanylate cyclase domain-containing protein [Actinomycetota bacterium]|nr:adenylate/guanylate cyclase domain-containing protein [Actinomycetota bacterium]
MESSEEIRRVLERFFDAITEGDDLALSNRISRQPGFERFGSDPEEWWLDGEQAALVWIQQMRELGGGYPWRRVGDVHALVEGTVGWGSFQAEFDSPEGTTPMRLTIVLHLEHGEWRIVQIHSSVPSTNESHGFLLTTSVDQIAQSVSAARPDLSSTSASDGTVTIAFTDIEDSTRLNDLLGDQRWLEVLRAHNDVIRAVTTDHGGSVVKNQGDGYMLAFPSARGGVRCARAIRGAIEERFSAPGSMIRVRIGLHVGETVREADDFFGHAVSYAARVASSAAGGEIVVSSLVRDLLVQTGEFEFGEPRVVELKGTQGTHRVYPVG